MSDRGASVDSILDAAQLAQLAELQTAAALAALKQMDLDTPDVASFLAATALQQAETLPHQAARWLAIATALNRERGNEPNLQAQIHYAQARLYVQEGDLAAAEAALRQAQRDWHRGGDMLAYNRGFLGLTQVLAMQGRYAEAETAIGQAIENLSAAATAEPALQKAAAAAHRNLANLLTYQEKHAAALVEYRRAYQLLEQLQIWAESQHRDVAEVQAEMAHVALNQANALMALDRSDEAEVTLQQAVSLFERVADPVSRGKARTNLGTLYVGTGRYAEALHEFERAADDLLGENFLLAGPPFTNGDAGGQGESHGDDEELAIERLRQADVLLLDRANAFVALNLLPEAMAALEQCETIFRRAAQPYELGQSLYTLGLLHLRNEDFDRADVIFTEAMHTFDTLHNQLWANRVRVALAVLAYRCGDRKQAEAQLSVLLATPASTPASIGDDPAVVTWDTHTLAEVRFLQIQLLLDQGAVDAARRLADGLARTLLGPDADPAPTQALPHLRLRLEHAQGRIAAAAANHRHARRRYATAIELLEVQRASLPLEEIRTAFLEDKRDVYADLVLDLLDESTAEPGIVAAAFNTVERARARSLLERLQTTVSHAIDVDGTSEPFDSGRQRLHWLYNRLLDNTGRRQINPQQMRTLQRQESTVQQREWRTTDLLTQAQPVDSATFQQALPAEQQALVYYIAGADVLCFLVERNCIQVKRRLCSLAELTQAQAELRFQLGRVELGPDYFARHAARLQHALKAALYHLYRLLVAPLEPQLRMPRLLVIAYGPLHLVPFHALWDGNAFLVERFEWNYAPSASLFVQSHRETDDAADLASLAGLALTDPSIPAARREVEMAARHFERAWLYLNENASYRNLHAAATQADILHLATHGLFRPDNPFFSALKLADGWIAVREIYRLPLKARLVILSACESGLGRVRGGDEVIGLARGFLGAGARSLLVSLWTVHDASAAELMDRFYTHLVNPSSTCRPTTALRMAQRDAIRDDQHPYFWAPFFLIG